MARAALELEGVSKTFGSTTVLTDLRLHIQPGEVHGLVGENGSGKSTVVKILAGVHEPDPGSVVRLHGQELDLPVRGGRARGIAIIHQDLALAEEMSVADNIGIGVGFDRPLVLPIAGRRERRTTRALLQEFALDVSPRSMVGSLSPAERAVVGILRAMRQMRSSRGSGHVLVLDEPTAALPRSESQRLLTLVRGLARSGAAVLFISHRMGEVLDVCDRITVLRSGHRITTVDAAAVTEREVVTHMLGYELEEFYPEKHDSAESTVGITVRELSGGTIDDISFSVARGEILGITGLAGMGQDELPYLIVGGSRRTAGSVVVGETAVSADPWKAQQAGVSLVPGNRTRDAIWVEASSAENLTLPFLGTFFRGGVLRKRAELEFAARRFEEFDVRPRQPGRHMAQLSGGNQQKVVIARCLEQQPLVILLHEPTQGVDAGAKREILGLIRAAADNGAAVVICSSDCEEVAETANRVLIMGYGCIDDELCGAAVTESQILAATQRAGSRRQSIDVGEGHGDDRASIAEQA